MIRKIGSVLSSIVENIFLFTLSFGYLFLMALVDILIPFYDFVNSKLFD